MTNILIDTNLWLYALIKPKESKYHEIHLKAKNFLKEKLINENINICFSTYQIGEILEMLRRAGLEPEKRDQLLNDFQEEGFTIVNLNLETVITSYHKSKTSNIHIYDYFVVYPLRNKINKIYSADEHLFHKDFTSFTSVSNPLLPWILVEGKEPVKKNT